MKIVRYASASEPSWGILDSDAIIPLAGSPVDWGPALVRNPESAQALVGVDGENVSASTVRLLPPLERGAKVVCVGVNYRTHVEAAGAAMPSAPVAFLKAPSALIGDGEEIVYPALTTTLDYEVELVAMIGAIGHTAAECVLGYTVGNDVTARDLQRGEFGLDLYSAKSLDRTSGVGPWIVTADEFGPPPVDLEMRLMVNGEQRQCERTSGMHWDIDEILAYVNARTRLAPGDLLFTGTPAGVGLEDGRFLESGDVVEATIEGIGSLTNMVGRRDGTRPATEGVRDATA